MDCMENEKSNGGFAEALTHRQKGDLISLVLFFQNKETRLNIKLTLPIL